MVRPVLRRRVRLLLAAAAALPLIAVGLPGTASAESTGTVSVLVPKRDCARPAGGHLSCLATHLVTRRVAASRAHAYPRRVSQAVGAGQAGGYTPTQVAKAYSLNPAAGAASNQVVAIVDAFHAPDAADHLATFAEQYGLPAETDETFRVIGQDGTSTLPTATNDGWAGETDLDLQAVRGLCHGCKILLVEASSDDAEDLGAAVDAAAAYVWTTGSGANLPVKIISNSYGGPESAGLSSFAAHYKHPGVAVLAATGDHGWFDWDWLNTLFNDDDSDDVGPGQASEVPASFSTVVGVGGTTLTVSSTGARKTETVWNRNGASDLTGSDYALPLGATGSGCSEYFPALSPQVKAVGYSTVGCLNKRKSAVDVAMLADPYTGFDVYSADGWATYGGTSLATPLAAATWALAGGPGAVSYPAANLYKHFAAKSNRGLYDVTSGGNGLCGSSSATTCAKYWGDPNKVSSTQRVPLDCYFAWGKHKAKTATYQCRARKGFDGPSGVGAPAGVTAFRP